MPYAKATKKSSGIVDNLMIAGVKILGERLLMPLVGNGNFVSGATKLGLAFASDKFIGGKTGNIISAGFMVDGAEDIVKPILGGFLNNGVQEMGGNKVQVL